MSTAIALFAAVALLASTEVTAQRTCYSRYRGYYQCGGLSTGARIGVGVGVAVGVLLLLMLLGLGRRRRMKSRFANVKPPALPYNNADGQGQNPYANNPPPPSGAAYQYGQEQHPSMGQSQTSYAAPAQPPQTYQPSMAQNYTGATAVTGNDASHEHGYEWQQARDEEERLRRDGGGGEPAPPGYNAPSVDPAQGYAPPPGAPPSKAT